MASLFSGWNRARIAGGRSRTTGSLGVWLTQFSVASSRFSVSPRARLSGSLLTFDLFQGGSQGIKRQEAGMRGGFRQTSDSLHEVFPAQTSGLG